MKKTAIVMAVAMLGLALFGATPAAADDEVDDVEEGPVEVQPVVDDQVGNSNETRVGFEGSGFDIANQEAGGEFVVGVNENPGWGSVSVEAGEDRFERAYRRESVRGNVAGTYFSAGVGGEATVGSPTDGSTFVAGGGGATVRVDQIDGDAYSYCFIAPGNLGDKPCGAGGGIW